MSKLKPSAQEGRALVMALIVLAVGSLLIPLFLAHASTNLLATRVTEEGMKEQYAADAGVEYAAWKLANDPVFLETLWLSASPVTLPMPTSVNAMMPIVQVEDKMPDSWGGRFGGQTTFPKHLLDVHFINENVGWAVGQQGKILKTYDGGWTWVVQCEGCTQQHLNSVFTLSLTEVWAAGANATLLHTTDGGETWQPVDTPGTPQALNSLFFVDDTGWAAGDNGKALFYNGTAWTDISPTGVSNKLNSIFFTNANFGWVVGDGGIVLNTTNGGTTWTSQDSGTNRDLNDVLFLDRGKFGLEDDYGWTVGDKAGPNQSMILKTTNGGTSWYTQTETTGIDFFDVHVLDPNKGWVVGQDGNIRKTGNGGGSWNFEDSRTDLDLKAVFFLDTNHGWAVGQNGIILVYNGTVWKPQNTFTDEALNAVWFVDNQHGWIVGDEGMIAATLDGKEWITKTNPTVGAIDLFGVSFTSPYTGTVGWTVGEASKFFKSDDAGDSWTLQYTAGVQLNDVYAISSTFAVAVGNRQGPSQSTILKTTDGGVNWDLQPIQDDPGKNLLGVFFIDPDKGWLVGEAGTVRITTDGGNTWSPPDTSIPGAKDLYDVTFLDTMTGWIVGESATLLKTTDGGITWSVQPILDDQGQLLLPGKNPPTFDAVSFPDANNGWIVGKKKTQYEATLLRTADGGDTWELLPAGTSQDMHDVFVFDPCNGWVVGDSGTILAFFCPPGTLAGGCGIFDVNSVANNTTITSRIRLCGDEMHIDSWEIK